jgi:endoglucanase
VTIARHAVLVGALLLAGTVHAAPAPCAPWPAWQQFKRLYLSDDGRVIDAGTARNITVSEGQAYALMFALIGNDPAAFDGVLAWTRNNLAGGDLTRSLPAWKWGRADDGRWTVLDANSASDADLWITYALGEASRLWHRDTYAETARALSESILREEVALIPGLGSTLLPGPKGFVSGQTWRLNASYSPIQVLRALGRESGNRLWDGVLASSVQVILASAPHGYASDWVAFRTQEGFGTDAATRGAGSYDAIRVYLWAGMLADADPEAAVLARALAPMIQAATAHAPAESIDAATLETYGEGPPGFTAALLPALARDKRSVVESYRKQIEVSTLKSDQHYYSDALTLFALGWLDGRYRFDRQGHLEVAWSASCHAP